MVIGAIIDTSINVHSQLKETGHVDADQAFGHTLEGAVIGGAPMLGVFAAPEIIASAGQGAATAGDTVGWNGLTNTGTRTMAAGSAFNDWLWNSSVGAITGNSSLSLLPDRVGSRPPTSGVLFSNGQEVPLESGRDGPALFAPGGPGSGFDSYTSTHVEGHAAAWMAQNGATTGTLFINNPPCLSCTRNLPSMLPTNSSLRIIGPSWFDAIFRAIDRGN